MGRASEALIIGGTIMSCMGCNGSWVIWMGIIGAILRYEEIAKTISKSRG